MAAKRSLQPTTNIKPNDHIVTRPYDTKNILELRASGKSYRDIARYYDKSVSTIHTVLGKKLKRLFSTEYDAYQTNPAEVLRAMAALAWSHAFDEERLKNASHSQLVLSGCQLYDKYRLESGQSTVNVGLRAVIEQMERERDQQPEVPDVVVQAVDGVIEDPKGQ